jgi:hypothetical protein
MKFGRDLRGQSLVEFALVAPLFTLVLGGIFTLGVGVFYQQQVTNAAREAARYAAIHSATSQCPTSSWLEPNWSQVGDPEIDPVDQNCDPPDLRWPKMTAHARSMIWGLDTSEVHVAACWSGYWQGETGYDAAPANADGSNDFRACTIGGVDPRTETDQIPCPPPLTTEADDQASNLAVSAPQMSSANQVTVYACFVWHPPFAEALIGDAITIRAVITEAMQHQQ